MKTALRAFGNYIGVRLRRSDPEPTRANVERMGTQRAWSDCPVTGEAWATRHDDGPITWDRADEQVHVVAELAEQPPPELSAKYEIGEWCPIISAYHARLREPDDDEAAE